MQIVYFHVFVVLPKYIISVAFIDASKFGIILFRPFVIVLVFSRLPAVY